MNVNMGQLVSVVIGVLTIIMAAFFWPTIQNNMDYFALVVEEHCLVGSERFKNLYDKDGDFVVKVGGTVGSDCSAADGTGRTVGNVMSEHGVVVGTQTATTVTFTTGDKWQGVLPMAQQYAGMTRIIAQALPIVAVTSFIGAISLGTIAGGSVGGLRGGLVNAIGALVVAIVFITLLPTLLREVDSNVYTSVSSTGFTVNNMFGPLQKMLVEFVTVIIAASLLAAPVFIGAWNFVGAFRTVRGRGRSLSMS